VLSAPPSSTSTIFAHVQAPDTIGVLPLWAVSVVKNAKRMSPCATPAGKLSVGEAVAALHAV